MSKEIKIKFKQVQAQVKAGTTVVDACKKVGLSVAHYYQQRRESKPKSKLVVHALPAQVPQGQAFIVFGSPQALAEFARSYS